MNYNCPLPAEGSGPNPLPGDRRRVCMDQKREAICETKQAKAEKQLRRRVS